MTEDFCANRDILHMSDTTFKTLGGFIHAELGIKMPLSKKQMVESRLKKRLIHLNIKTYAACSRGHEPYTIAMVLSEFAARNPRLSLNFSILGTDISPQVLEASRNAIYPHDEITPVPLELRKKYLLRGKNQKKDLVRIIPGLRQMVTIRQFNLMNKTFDIKNDIDIVFCRNVMIYFDKKTQDELLTEICAKLRTNGYLFMGHSEVIQSQNYPLIPAAPTIYMKKSGMP